MRKWINAFLRAARGFDARVARLFSRRKARKTEIPAEIRAICERYGEEVIRLVVASGHTPRATELRTIYQTDQTVAQASAWVDERSRKNKRRERLTLLLEFVVVGLIGWEIFLGYRQEDLQSQNFTKQQKVLTNLDNSSAATAAVLKNSAQNFQDSASAAKKQIEFLQGERQERDDAVLMTLYGELSFDQSALVEDTQALQTELGVLKEGKTLIAPINTLHTAAWELLRLYLPRQIRSNAVVLSRVTDIYTFTGKINELIRSREDYRIHNAAMDNYARRMQAYDQDIQQVIVDLTPHLKEVLPMLKAMIKASPHQVRPNAS